MPGESNTDQVLVALTSNESLTRRETMSVLARAALLVHPATSVLLRTGVRLEPNSQALIAQVRRLVEAMELLGEPFSREDVARIERAIALSYSAKQIAELRAVLDPRCLLVVRINPEARVSILRGDAPPRLLEQGWRTFLVRVHNESGATARLATESPQAAPVYRVGTNLAMAPRSVLPQDVRDRWLQLAMYDQRPLEPTLSGLDLEYRIIQLYSRDRGRREARIGAHLGAATADIGGRDRVAVLFNVDPSAKVTLHIRDEHGKPTVGALLIRDRAGRVYPAQAKRLAPDFFFQPQIYRADGEHLLLPAGNYTVEYGRGPEYHQIKRELTVSAGAATQWRFDLERWIDPPSLGWYSGDHHIHAAGCAHYESPTQGVNPEDMMRQVLGEALSVGSVLNWGPSYYYQRQFFEARDHHVSTKDSLLRYDLEISGFPSSYCGHLVLLRLRDQDYPGTRQIEDWPTWDLPILKWAKAQGAVTGFAHSGLGLAVESLDLPTYELPRFNGIGANEFIVDVAHDVVDFISTNDTPFRHELNIWYHTLNCGFRTRASGETDFPCMSDQRVGAGRSYVKLDTNLTYDGWCEGVRLGRSYVSDGTSHLLDFRVGSVGVGESGSELRLDRAQTVRASARVAALLAEQAPVSPLDPNARPFWTLEHARVAGTRRVVVEAVVNGMPVARTTIGADGSLQEVGFDLAIARSSWVAFRILGSSHTNPVFVLMDGRPIRASRRSADWCLRAVDQCWSQKSGRIAQTERESAGMAYEFARSRYRQILAEADVD